MTEIIEYEEMQKRIADLNPFTEKMTEDFYTECVDKSFTIYDGRKNKAVCTRCGIEWDTYPREYSRLHGLEGVCPQCGSLNVYLSAGRGRQCYEEYHRVLSFAESGGTLWAFLNWIIVRFDPFGRPDLSRSLTDIYIINREDQQRWSKTYSYRNGWKPQFELRKNMKIPAAPTAPYCWESKWRDHVCLAGFRDMVARSDCKYFLEPKYLLEMQGIDLPAYFGTMMKYHSVELLAKAGFERIAQHKINGHGCRQINWRAGSLEKILKLPKRDIKRLRTLDPSVRMLELYKLLPEDDRRDVNLIVLRDMMNWDRYDGKTYTNIYKQEVEKYMPFDKWCRWVNTQLYLYDEESPHLLADYKDYIRTATLLGLDIHKKSVLRPKDLEEAHDEAVDQLRIERNSRIDALIAMNTRHDKFSSKTLMIVPAKCQEDLNKESAKLCHCVKTYGDKIATGACFIFFIRDIKAPDEPFYTLECKPSGEFVQCRGKHNCSMTDEVKLFTDAFVKKLKADIKKERETACQTA